MTTTSSELPVETSVNYFAVTRDAGPTWTDGKGAFEQSGVDEHAAFMNALADDGVLLFAGPLAGSEHGRIRVLLIVKADSEAAIIDRLAADPWEQSRRLVTTSVEPWNLLVGADRISTAEPADRGADGAVEPRRAAT